MYGSHACTLSQRRPQYCYYHIGLGLHVWLTCMHTLTGDHSIHVSLLPAHAEDYWEATSREHLTSFSDQERMNYGLKAMNVRWTLNRATASDEVPGVCSNGMTVTLLPYTVACRASNCKKSGKSSYYVWHKGGHRDGDSKMRNAEVGDTWFLRGDWQMACKDVAGYQWFKCISNHFILVT